MTDPFKYEIELKGANKPGRKRSSLPWLYPWQYGKNLYSEDDFYSMINAYKSWVFVCASKNATTVANIPLRLYVAKNKKGQKIKWNQTKSISEEQDRFIREDSTLNSLAAVRKGIEFEEVVDHPFLNLMSSVNNFMNSYDLKEMTQLYEELTGNAFWHILEDRMGIPREIWIIPPQNCRIIPDEKLFISGYQYEKGTTKIDLKEKNVVHFKFPNPKNQYYGFSPFNAISEEFGLNKSINEYEAAVFKNGGGNLSGVFETDTELGDHEFERLKLEIQQAFSGTGNAGKQPLLDSGLKYKPIGSSPKEMSHLGGREFVKEAILNAYGQALGMYSKDSNRANVDGAIYQYMKFTIAPRLAKFQEKVNEKLIWKYDEKLFVKFDSCVPEDKLFKLEERVKHINWGIENINEVREGLGKKPFDKKFNEPILPVNMTTIEGIFANIGKGNGSGNIVSDPKKMMELLEK